MGPRADESHRVKIPCAKPRFEAFLSLARRNGDRKRIMKKTLLAGLAGLSLAFAAGASLAAEGDAAAPAPAAAAAAPSVDNTPIVELVDNPTTKAVLDKHLPGVAEHPSYDMFKGMTLRQVEPMSQGMLDDAKMDAIQHDLDALAKPVE